MTLFALVAMTIFLSNIQRPEQTYTEVFLFEEDPWFFSSLLSKNRQTLQRSDIETSAKCKIGDYT